MLNLLNKFNKINTLKKSIEKKSFLKVIESIETSIKSISLTYNKPIYSSYKEAKELINESRESSNQQINEYVEPLYPSDKASFWMQFFKETVPLYDGGALLE